MAAQPPLRFPRFILIFPIVGAVAGVLAAALFVPLLGGILALVFLLVFFLLFRVLIRPILEMEKIWKTGKPARAQVVDYRVTQIKVNQMPVAELNLRVEAVGLPPWNLQVRALLTPAQVMQLQPGIWLDVLYDPANPKRVVVPQEQSPQVVQLEAAAPPTPAPAQAATVVQEIEALYLRLCSEGAETDGVVLAVWPLGIQVNGVHPVMGMRVRVLAETGTWEAELRAVIPAQDAELYAPGTRIRVYYDPIVPQCVALAALVTD